MTAPPKAVDVSPSKIDPPAKSQVHRIAYRISEVAAMIGVSKSFVYKEVREGRLRAVKVQKNSLIARAEAERYFGQYFGNA